MDEEADVSTARSIGSDDGETDDSEGDDFEEEHWMRTAIEKGAPRKEDNIIIWNIDDEEKDKRRIFHHSSPLKL